jgi:hypothetical protein
MAYMKQDKNGERRGPFPNLAGEFCGNSYGEEWSHQLFDDHGSFLSGRIPGRPDWATVRKGRPHPCKAGSTDDLEVRGMFGLYLKADHPVPPEDHLGVNTGLKDSK